MTTPTKEQITAVRWLAIICGIALFATDYGMDLWAKPVPAYAYFMIAGIAFGVDAKAFREVILRLMAGGQGTPKP